MNTPPPDQRRWFTEQVQPHVPMLRAYLRKQFPRFQDVDDVVQESHLRLLRARDERPILSVRAYLFTIARHITLGWLRRKRVHAEVSVGELPETPSAGSDSDTGDTVSRRQEFDLAIEAIDALPGRCREIFVLRTLHGRSHKEIAAQLGLSEKTVRVQMTRGMRKCADYLRAHGVEPRSNHEC